MRALADAPSAFGATLAEWTGEGDTEQRWRQRLHDVPINLVAVDAGVPVGMLSVTAAVGGDHAEVISVWAAPEARGRGVGDALLRAAIASARARGDSRLTLKVRTANEALCACIAGRGSSILGGPRLLTLRTPNVAWNSICGTDGARRARCRCLLGLDFVRRPVDRHSAPGADLNVFVDLVADRDVMNVGAQDALRLDGIGHPP